MTNRKSTDTSPEFDPVIEILKGADPVQVARRTGISAAELLERRDAFLKNQANRAHLENIVFHEIGRNDPCPCGSGLKYKKCCLRTHEQAMAGVDPEDIRKQRQSEREKTRRDKQVQDGYALLTQGNYDKAQKLARRSLERYPEDDRLHDILATSALYLSHFDEAAQISRARWKVAEEEKAFFLAHGRHSYDDPDVPPGHVYAPQAWLEKYWIALQARDYASAYPSDPDPEVVRLVKKLQSADDMKRFPQSREEGLQVRKEALAKAIQALKAQGPRARPYILPLCTRYSWTALLIPEILLYWQDDASIRTLVEIALFHYPFLSESCLKALEQLGASSIPHLKAAFERDREFDSLKIGLISVAGQIGTPEALEWITTLLDHPDAAVVNWAGGVLGKAGCVQALKKLKEANQRIGGEPRILEAIERLSQLQQAGKSAHSS